MTQSPTDLLDTFGIAYEVDPANSGYAIIDGQHYGLTTIRPDSLVFKRLVERHAAKASEATFEDTLEMDIAREERRLEIRDLAAERFRAKRAAAKAKDFPTGLSGTNFLATDFGEESYLIRHLWPKDGRIILTAPFKAGKSTMVGNIVRTLVDGDRFLDAYDLGTDTTLKVALIDNEMSERKLQQWLREQKVRNTDDFTIYSLRGNLTSFDIMDPATRTRWADLLRGHDVVIFDCLRPVLDALGLDENSQAGAFLTAFSELCGEAGVSDSMVVHHTGHGEDQRARGDSAILGWPDANWNIVRQDVNDAASPRFFKAFGRDVDQAEMGLELHDGVRLRLVQGNRRTSKVLRDLAAIYTWLEQQDPPGPGLNEILKARAEIGDGLSEGRVRDAVKLGVNENYLCTAEGANKKTHHRINPIKDPRERQPVRRVEHTVVTERTVTNFFDDFGRTA